MGIHRAHRTPRAVYAAMVTCLDIGSISVGSARVIQLALKYSF